MRAHTHTPDTGKSVQNRPFALERSLRRNLRESPLNHVIGGRGSFVILFVRGCAQFIVHIPLCRFLFILIDCISRAD